MRRFPALVQLIRPLNLLMIGLGVVIGGVLSAGEQALAPEVFRPLLVAAVAAAWVGAGANALNDLLDRHVDQVNRPERPLPLGTVTVSAARGTWVLATLIGIIMSAFLSFQHLIMAAGAAILLYLYNSKLKGWPVIGNVVIAVVVGTAILFGGLTAGALMPAAVGAVFALLTTLAREVVKDIEDVAGDARAGVATVPLVFGLPAARVAASLVIGLTIVLTPVPFLVFGYSTLFLLTILATNLFLLRSLWLIPETSAPSSRASIWLKGAMLAGLLALATAGATF